MMRVCHLNTCPVGIATQDPALRRRFTGTPEHVVRYFLFVAEHLRELMAALGIARLADVVGRSDLLRRRDDPRPWLAGLDLGALMGPGAGTRVPAPGTHRPADHGLEAALDTALLPRAAAALAGAGAVVLEAAVRNTDRSVGAILAGAIARRAGAAGLPDDAIVLRLQGYAGQSLAAFAPRGLTIDLEGACNDYAGKGLSGGRLIVRPPARAGFVAERNVIAGNTVLYGATSGEAFLRGCAGERFCVRNSGATAVVEGVGDHGCEYMTGGVVCVLGETGPQLRRRDVGRHGVRPRPRRRAARSLQPGIGRRSRPPAEADEPLVRDLLERHLAATGSAVAGRVLAAWPDSLAALREGAAGRRAPAARRPRRRG